MPSTDAILSCATVVFVLIVIPGPSVLFVIGRALAHGRTAALASVAGNTTGVFLQACAVAIGLGGIISRSIAVFTVLKLCGAAYLIYLGVQAIRDRKSFSTATSAAVSVPSGRFRFRQGFIVGVTNPKGFVIFSAVLPQFVEPGQGHVPLQMFVFGCITVSIAAVTDSVWATIAGSARAWLARSPRRSAAISTGGGVMMIGLGAQLAISGRHD